MDKCGSMLKMRFLLCLYDRKYDNDVFIVYVKFYTSAKCCDEHRNVSKEKYVLRNNIICVLFASVC